MRVAEVARAHPFVMIGVGAVLAVVTIAMLVLAARCRPARVGRLRVVPIPFSGDVAEAK